MFTVRKGGDSMTLGERIKEFRHMEGLSQEGLAEKLNVSRQAITKWESDNGLPSVEMLIKLHEVLDCSIDYLLIGETETKNELSTDSDVRGGVELGFDEV